MKIFNKRMAPKEVRDALGVLDEASRTFDNCFRSSLGAPVPEAFQLVRKQIEEALLAHPDAFVRIVQEGVSPRERVYSLISDIAGNLLKSGQYHMCRGVLSPLGPGEGLLGLFDMAVDELVRIGAMDSGKAETEKAAIRKNIEEVG